MTNENVEPTRGFYILGPVSAHRRPVNWSAVFRAYCSLGPNAETNREGYLSAFLLGRDFDDLLRKTGSPKGFDGVVWSRWLWFDVDSTDLEQSRQAARKLAAGIADRYRIDGDDLLLFFSGSKGFHIGIPMRVFGDAAVPSTIFNKVCRAVASGVAGRLGVGTDEGVYDKVRAFRLPNSKHAKTGLHKRRLTFGELMGLTIQRITELAKSPQAFDVPDEPDVSDIALADWKAAVDFVEQSVEAARRPGTRSDTPKLTRSTIDFIRDGADPGDRHRRLFSASANLAEFADRDDLIRAVLTGPGRDSGLSPQEVDRQIRCGIEHATNKHKDNRDDNK